MNLTEQQLSRAIYSVWDFQQACSALTFLLQDCDFDAKYSNVELRRFRCYESTIIISMARPFEASRNGTTLNCRVTGIQLDSDEKSLLERVMYLRRKIIAHSDEEEMHFLSSTFLVLDGEVNFPHLQFDEKLHLDLPTLRRLDNLLLKLIHQLGVFFFRVARDAPHRLQKYQIPTRISSPRA